MSTTQSYTQAPSQSMVQVFCAVRCKKSHRTPTENNQSSWCFLVPPFQFLNILDYNVESFPLEVAERNFSNDSIMLQFAYNTVEQILTPPSIFFTLSITGLFFTLGRNRKNVFNLYVVHRNKRSYSIFFPLHFFFFFVAILTSKQETLNALLQ